jgi:hypothetical protein
MTMAKSSAACELVNIVKRFSGHDMLKRVFQSSTPVKSLYRLSLIASSEQLKIDEIADRCLIPQAIIRDIQTERLKVSQYSVSTIFNSIDHMERTFEMCLKKLEPHGLDLDMYSDSRLHLYDSEWVLVDHLLGHPTYLDGKDECDEDEDDIARYGKPTKSGIPYEYATFVVSLSQFIEYWDDDHSNKTVDQQYKLLAELLEIYCPDENQFKLNLRELEARDDADYSSMNITSFLGFMEYAVHSLG